MDHKLLLVKSITLLYREGQMAGKTSNSAEMVNNALVTIKVPESFAGGDFGRDPILALRETARWMAANPLDYTYDKSELLQRIRVNVGNDDALYEAFVDGIATDLGEEELKKKCLTYRSQMRAFLEQREVKAIVKGYYTQMHFQEQTVDWHNVVKDMIEKLDPYKNIDGGAAEHRSVVRNIRLSDNAAVASAFERASDELDSRGIIRFGHQGLNRMFGSNMGGRRGEMLVIGALQHNYKSGLALDMLKGAALYNKPYMRDPTRKPMLMRMSFENPIELDILHLYKSLVENETGLPVDPKSVDKVEASRYVYEQLTQTGYELDMMQIDPSEFTYHDLFNEVQKRQADGFEIHMLNLDYLNMISKRGCAQGPAGVDIRDLFRRTRNFTSKNGIFCVTPHQLSTESKMLVRQGVNEFVKEIANKGYYDGCRTIDQEVDMEIYIHIEKVNGESYLTMQRGKHRKVGITPARDMYCVYKFEDVGNIPDDVLDVDRSRRSVGGNTLASGGDAPWYAGV